MKATTIGSCLAFILLAMSCSSVDDGSGAALETSSGASESGASIESELRVLTCRSSVECPRLTHCSTEDGVCNRPPGCKPGSICPAVCYGTCVPEKIELPPPIGGGVCGDKVCSAGTFCCNASCGTCAPLGGACTQQVCLPKE
ncbi:MAG TPA: hypothetical protein VFQ61_20160 [Polyangiaceae bacterium]|nr:hypothetical protein [Polyangiaceae bacterium]